LLFGSRWSWPQPWRWTSCPSSATCVAART
jgi:hypothetical protein